MDESHYWHELRWTDQTLIREARGEQYVPLSRLRQFWEAIQHYGTDCWVVEILWDGLTLEEANVYEEIEIRDNETLFPYGYNLTTGGLNSEPSPETRKKLSASHKGRKHTAETRAKISMNHGMRGKKNPFFGRKHTAETRAKISVAIKGRNLAAEHCKKLSESRKGKNNHNYGKNLSAEHRKKLSESKLGMSQEQLIFQIQWFSCWGWSQKKIARELRKSEETIRKYAKLAK